MKAVLIGENRELRLREVPDPVMAKDEALVKIKAAALNRADLMQREGDYPPPPGCPEWMGLEIAGVIEDIGETAMEKSRFRRGDEVCALLGGGGYAEYANVRYDMLMPVPKGFSLIEAAAVPEAYATAYLNLFVEGGLKSGDTLLMNAGASGLASVVIPMAKAFGARVVTTVLSDEIAMKIRPFGADIVVNTRREDIVDTLKRLLDEGRPVGVAIDCLGGEVMGRCLPYLERGARWIMIATLAGNMTSVDLKNVYVRNIRIIGSTLRSKTPEKKAELLANLVRDVWPKIESGLIRPSIYRVLPLERAEEAHAILQRGENVGKVVLSVD